MTYCGLRYVRNKSFVLFCSVLLGDIHTKVKAISSTGVPKGLYIRLPCIQYEIVICTAAVFHAKDLHTLLPCIKYKFVMYTAAVSPKDLYVYTAAEHPVKSCHSHANCFSCKTFYIQGCRESSKKVIYTAAASYDETNCRKTFFLRASRHLLLKLILYSSARGTI